MGNEVGSGRAVLDARALVVACTAPVPVPLVPEVVLRQGAGVVALWEQVEAVTGRTGTAPPFWAYPWAGGQALARHVLDHREQVAGRRVLDLASGSGLVAVAAALAGAAAVTAVEVDELAVAATALNAAANGVSVDAVLRDVLDSEGDGGDLGEVGVVLAGDVFYERAMAERVLPFLRRAAARGTTVLVGDPGRAYLPASGLEQVAVHEVPVVAELEDAATKRTTVWRVLP